MNIWGLAFLISNQTLDCWVEGANTTSVLCPLSMYCLHTLGLIVFFTCNQRFELSQKLLSIAKTVPSSFDALVEVFCSLVCLVLIEEVADLCPPARCVGIKNQAQGANLNKKSIEMNKSQYHPQLACG